ncbi:ABC transporter ATP-binding protein [Halorubellus litoreus]|uniref:ABC transporter ATP-binding protein n=1 Tax=Halorubellus litoreus TaxID=755308 RepID=A0ABD5VAL2_9EURY
MPAPALHVDGLTKRYGNGPDATTAVDDLSFTVERGEVFGLLGPNGAGKSTTLDVLVGYQRPTDGHVDVLGLDPTTEPAAVRERTGVLPDGYGVYPERSGRAHVEYVATARGVDLDPTTWLERVDLGDAASRPAGEYSKGMRQRLAFAMALVGDPDLLVLDEPSTGLDPEGVATVRERIEAASDRGTTVVLSSHRLAQVERVCDRLAVVHDGSLLAVDDLASLRNAYGLDADRVRAGVDTRPDGVRERVSAVDGVTAVSVDDDVVRVECTERAKKPALDAIETTGATVVDVDVDRPSLEELFLRIADDDATATGHDVVARTGESR